MHYFKIKKNSLSKVNQLTLDYSKVIRDFKAAVVNADRYDWVAYRNTPVYNTIETPYRNTPVYNTIQTPQCIYTPVYNIWGDTIWKWSWSWLAPQNLAEVLLFKINYWKKKTKHLFIGKKKSHSWKFSDKELLRAMLWRGVFPLLKIRRRILYFTPILLERQPQKMHFTFWLQSAVPPSLAVLVERGKTLQLILTLAWCWNGS